MKVSRIICFIIILLAVSEIFPSVEAKHSAMWYKNWLTCDVCWLWAETMRQLIVRPEYAKGLKGLLWFICAARYS